MKLNAKSTHVNTRLRCARVCMYMYVGMLLAIHDDVAPLVPAQKRSMHFLLLSKFYC